MSYNNDFRDDYQENSGNLIKLERVAAAPKPTLADEVELLCMDDIEMKIIKWMWEYRIAYGKINVVAGDGGLGKSQTTVCFAATVSIGGCFPNCDTPTKQGNVIFLSAEDDPADTIKPRLEAAGADMTKVFVLDAIKTKTADDKEDIRTFNLVKDIERLAAVIEQKGNVRLIIIDPISAYLGKTDSNNNADMRGLLTPLAAMAAKHGAAILLVTHLSKSQNPDIMARVIGSVGLIAAARAGFVVVKDEKTPDTRYFLPIKNNIGNDNEGFAYHIETVELPNDITTSKIVWHAGTVSAHSILNPQEETKPTATNGASAFLQDLLSDKPMLASDIFEEGIGAGYNKAAIQRAANRLQVKRNKQGMGGGWLWSLPHVDYEDCEDTEDCMNIRTASSTAYAPPS